MAREQRLVCVWGQRVGFDAPLLRVPPPGEDLPLPKPCSTQEVGAVCEQGLLRAHHVFHPGRQGLRFSSPKPPLWGFLHEGGGE